MAPRRVDAAAQIAIATPADATVRPAIRPAIAPFGDHGSEVAREKGRLLREAATGAVAPLRASARAEGRLGAGARAEGRLGAGAPGLAVREQVHADIDAAAKIRTELRAADRAERAERKAAKRAEHFADKAEDIADTAEDRAERAAERAKDRAGKRPHPEASLSARAAASAELPDVGF